MALVGRLKDVSPAEILHFLAMSDKTGKLALTTGAHEGLVVFREGHIIYAASSSVRETFGSIVTGLGLATDVELREALARQHRSREEKRLGTILVEMDVLTTANLQQALHQQVVQVLQEIFSWHQGFFKFRNLEISDRGEVEVDARNLLLEQPIDAEKVALEAARSLDESVHADDTANRRPTGNIPTDSAGGAPLTLSSVIGSPSAPAVTGELVRAILDLAAEVVARVVILTVRGQTLHGVAQIGLTPGETPAAQRVRSVRLPLSEPSEPARAMQYRNVCIRKPVRTPANEALFEVLAGDWPMEGVAIPLAIDGEVLLVVYGDNIPLQMPIPDAKDLVARLEELVASHHPVFSADS